MERIIVKERLGWRETIRNEGLTFNDAMPDVSYWQEGRVYNFSMPEIEMLERAVKTLFDMFVEAGDHIVKNALYARLGIPEWAADAIAASWDRDDPSVYGRFDLRYGGNSPLVKNDPTLAVPKLLEFNADTPTSLLEAGVIQWNWYLYTRQSGDDQWNLIHEMLVKVWRKHLQKVTAEMGRAPKLYLAFTSEESSGEDEMNVRYMAETAREAGWDTEVIYTESIGRRNGDGMFVDVRGSLIKVIFKLYPWEMILDENFGKTVVHNLNQQTGPIWIEPIYKALWSNKGILPILWELFGNDPARSQFLLPTYFEHEAPTDMRTYVRKPLLGREGANVTIVEDGDVITKADGMYGREGFVKQGFAPLPDFGNQLDGPRHPVLGAWVVDGDPAGLSIREGGSLITDNSSFFVPHAIGRQVR